MNETLKTPQQKQAKFLSLGSLYFSEQMQDKTLKYLTLTVPFSPAFHDHNRQHNKISYSWKEI